MRGPPGPHGAGGRAELRTGTSAHPPGFGVYRVRGPPGPHGAGGRAELRTGTSAHPQGSASTGCADLPVRMELVAGPNCGRGRPRTARVRGLQGARTSRSAWGWRQGRIADGDVRAPPACTPIGYVCPWRERYGLVHSPGPALPDERRRLAHGIGMDQVRVEQLAVLLDRLDAFATTLLGRGASTTLSRGSQMGFTGSSGSKAQRVSHAPLWSSWTSMDRT